jgi:hypothetical protein
VDEPTASLDPFAGPEVTGRAPPEEGGGSRSRTGAVAASRPVPASKKTKSRAPEPAVAPTKPVRVEDASGIKATTRAGQAAPETASAATVEVGSPPAGHTAQPTSGAARNGAPLDDVQIRRSDFEAQVPSGPPAAHVSRNDF